MLVGDSCLSTIVFNVIMHLFWLDKDVVCHDGFPYVGVPSFLYESSQSCSMFELIFISIFVLTSPRYSMGSTIKIFAILNLKLDWGWKSHLRWLIRLSQMFDISLDLCFSYKGKPIVNYVYLSVKFPFVLKLHWTFPLFYILLAYRICSSVTLSDGLTWRKSMDS